MAERDVYGAHTVTSLAGSIQFDADLPYALYDGTARRYTLLGPRLAVTTGGRRCAVGCRDRDGMTILLYADGSKGEIAPSFGRYAAAIRSVGETVEVYIEQPGQTGIQVYSEAGMWLRRYDTPYSATGILRILPDGEPLLTTDSRCSRTVAGVQMGSVTEEGGYVLGIGDGGDSADGCVILAKPDGSVWMWQGYTPLPPRLAVSGDRVRIAISAEGAPEPDAVIGLMEPYRPYVPKPLPAPVIPPLNRALWVDDQSGQGYGNCGGSGSPRVIEDARYVLPIDEPNMVACYHGPWEGSDMAQTIALCQRLAIPCLLYDDGHGPVDAQPYVNQLQAAGVTVWIGVSGYPAKYEMMGDTFARLEARMVNDPRASTLTLPGYNVQAIAEDQVADLFTRAQALLSLPHLKAVLVFGLDRTPRYLWPRQWVQALTSAVQVPEIAGPPVVIPPVIPIPGTDAPIPGTPKDSHKGKTAGIVGAAAGIGVFVAWLIRKLRRKA